MKKLFLVLIFMIGCYSLAQAQFYVGGRFSYTNQDSRISMAGESEKANASSLSIGPKIGYFFNEKWSVGISLQYGHDKIEYDSGSFAESNGWGVTPYVRYLCLSKGKFHFGAEGRIGMTNSKAVHNPVQSSQYEYRNLSYGIALAPVMTYDISRHWMIETTLDLFTFNYYSTKRDGDITGENSAISFELDSFMGILSNIKLGLAYKF